ncbi:ketoacyl-ACP synthase III [Clostridium sediminicola]|uniref:3-oxoacyl-ACP synthase n=1 Tax=Clostridium sediminicola TaxID=3114879 RepID=UPI0031F1E086
MINNNVVGIQNIGIYVPKETQTSAYIADKSGIPQDIIEKKFGIIEKHKAGLNEHVSDMAIKAAKITLENFDPMDLDLVVYCGSEYKDYYLFNLAAKVQNAIGAKNANAFEIHSLCSAGVWSLNVLKSMMLSNSDINNVLLISSSKETDLIDYKNERARFMFNFGDGASGALLVKGCTKNQILSTHMITDGGFAEDVGVYGVGSQNYYNYETLNYDLRNLDVKDPKSMKERLDPISLDNFCKVITKAVEKSGYTVDEINFLASIFMKKSILNKVLERVHLTEENSFVLEKYGHCQSADAYISLVEAEKLGRLKDGDLTVMLGSGTGYTWAATAILWGELKLK